MTIAETLEQLLKVKRLAKKNDPEAAHSEEDDLMKNVLTAIANGDAEDI